MTRERARQLAKLVSARRQERPEFSKEALRRLEETVYERANEMGRVKQVINIQAGREGGEGTK